jgi:hypothetical protein
VIALLSFIAKTISSRFFFGERASALWPVAIVSNSGSRCSNLSLYGKTQNINKYEILLLAFKNYISVFLLLCLIQLR